MEPEVRDALLTTHLQFRSTEVDGVEAVRLGGLTNRVYRVGDWCLRLPGEGTETYIDRRSRR